MSIYIACGYGIGGWVFGCWRVSTLPVYSQAGELVVGEFDGIMRSLRRRGF